MNIRIDLAARAGQDVLTPDMKTNRPQSFRLMALLAVGLSLFQELAADSTRLLAAEASAARPNIILIMSDDMGYSDVGAYGGEIETPTLDSLAGGGLRFTQFYNTARCCPTRASLLTGLYPHQAGVGHMMEDRGSDAYRGRLNRRSVTLAEALRPAGYRTYAVGKWHVTPGNTAEALEDTSNWPLQRGFDRFYGTIHGAGSFWDPSSLVRDNQRITAANDPDYPEENYYYTDAISHHAAKFIREHEAQSADQPFLMYVTYTAPHWPMHAKPEDIEKYRGRYDGGYEAIRRARFEKQKRLGVINGNTELSEQAGDWSAVENVEFETRCMEVYAAMIDSMDQGIGRIVRELKEQGRFDNTLILFLHDNGGCAEGMGRNGPFVGRPTAPTLPALDPDFQQLGSVPTQTRDGYPVRRGYGVMPGPADTYVAYGRGWANVSNTPFREYKHWVHEGGISTPLIAHWPRGIESRLAGKLTPQPGHLIDVMATCLELAGADYPGEFNGERIQPFEGASLTPVFRGDSIAREQPIFFEHEGNRAIRDGRWKLVMKWSRNDPQWELYDMENDRSETHDLAADRPAQVTRLAALWREWADRVGVRPWPLN